ncbi:MAG: hypothetical protein JNL01_03430 [Bdellovibrionales bacterium]|nr:hypothetical protein [Bdellovibrionales bacterium]
MKKNSTLFLGIIIGAMTTAIPFTFSSCGQLNAPLGVLGEADSIPELSLPFTTGFTISSAQLQSSAGFTIALGAGAAPIAPANGIVISYDGTTMLIQHSNRLTSKLTNVPTPIIRVGDYVTTGQQLSQTTFGTGGGFTFSVLLDGKTICPWSFLTAAARTCLSGLGTACNAFAWSSTFASCTQN